MECVVCQDFYNADIMVPRVLSCGHTFCSMCIRLMLDHSTGCSLICIVCKLPHYALVNSPMQVPYNFALLDIMFSGGYRIGRGAMRGRGGAMRGRGGAMRGRGGAMRGRGGAMRGRGAGMGMPGVPTPGVPSGFGYLATEPIAVAVPPDPEGPPGHGSGHGLLQMVPTGGPPALVPPDGQGGAGPMPLPAEGQAGEVAAVQEVLASMSPIGQASGGSPRDTDRNSSETSSASTDEEECPNRNRKLNAPKPIGERFRVTLQQSPGMVWMGGRLKDGNQEQFAFMQNPQGGNKKNGRNKKRNGNRGQCNPGSSGGAGGRRDPPPDSEEDAIIDYVPILGPKTR